MMSKLMIAGLATVAMLATLCRVGPPGRPPAEAGAGVVPGTDVTPSPASGRIVADGRLATYPGAEVVVAAEVAGKILRLLVAEGSAVRRGDLIAELSSDDLRASRDEAVARIDEAEAEMRFYEREVERRRILIARRSASDVELDANQRDLDVAKARRRAAIAVRDRLDALIARTRITAPIDGVVIERTADPGETVPVAAPLVTIADLARVRVEAEVDEIDLDGIAVGTDTEVSAEGFPGRTWRGRVEEVPHAVVGRRLRPEDAGRPVDTRVLLVKVALLESTPLKLGQRVAVRIARPLTGPGGTLTHSAGTTAASGLPGATPSRPVESPGTDDGFDRSGSIQ